MSFSFNIKEQILIGLTIVILLAVVFGVFVFKPQYDKFSDAQGKQTEEQQTQEKKKTELASLKGAKDNAAVTEAKSLSLSRRMPEEADLPTVLVELDELGKRHNVKVLDIAPTEATASTGFSYIPVELKIAGTYFNITDFLYGIVKLPREYTLGNVDVEISDAGYPILSATVKAYAFTYTPNATQTNNQNSTGSATTGTAKPAPTEAQ